MMTRKISAGVYEVDTMLGIATILRGTDDLWFLTYPGEATADDFYSTKREAVAALDHWLSEQDPFALKGGENANRPND